METATRSSGSKGSSIMAGNWNSPVPLLAQALRAAAALTKAWLRAVAGVLMNLVTSFVLLWHAACTQDTSEMDRPG